MPELPEVEIVRQSLNKNIKNQRIKKIIIRNRNLRFKVPVTLSKFLKNKTIKGVNRFSKYLIIVLSDNRYCLIHLGMSGTIHIINKKKKSKFSNTSFYHSPILPKKHNHIEFFFNKLKVIYNDPRRFGFFQQIEDKNDLKNRFSHLGPEPFDKRFNIKYVSQFLKNKKKNIKSFLLDQKFVSGIGNIYANEILFLSKINPNKKAKHLNVSQYHLLIQNSKKVLKNAIKKGGSSIKDFKNVDGKEGNFQDNFYVYLRENLKCKKTSCRGKIKKKVISNRSTFFCNLCQK